MSDGIKRIGLASAASAAMLLVLLVPTSAGAASNWESCRSGGQVGAVHVKRLRCPKAVKVARKAARRFNKKGTNVTNFNDFKCKSKKVANFTYEAKCKRPDKMGRNQVVKFAYGDAD